MYGFAFVPSMRYYLFLTCHRLVQQFRPESTHNESRAQSWKMATELPQWQNLYSEQPYRYNKIKYEKIQGTLSLCQKKLGGGTQPRQRLE